MAISFQKLRTFLSALANLVLIGGYLFLRISNIIKTTPLIDAGIIALAGLLMYLLPFFKKNRIAFRFDAWAFFLIFLPLVYAAVSTLYDFPFSLTTYLPRLANYSQAVYAFLGYALGYVFFEHSTLEYEKGKSQERSARRSAKREMRRKYEK